jgi:hypothetical protein
VEPRKEEEEEEEEEYKLQTVQGNSMTNLNFITSTNVI